MSLSNGVMDVILSSTVATLGPPSKASIACSSPMATTSFSSSACAPLDEPARSPPLLIHFP